MLEFHPAQQQYQLLIKKQGINYTLALDSALYSIDWDTSNAISLNHDANLCQHALLWQMPIPLSGVNFQTTPRINADLRLQAQGLPKFRCSLVKRLNKIKISNSIFTLGTLSRIGRIGLTTLIYGFAEVLFTPAALGISFPRQQTVL